jgi:hypothetical protein
MMNQINHWSRGDVILYRGMWRNEVLWAIPVIVVRDDSHLIIVYWRSGTPVKKPSKRMSPMELMENPKPDLIDGQWTDTDILMLVTPGESHSISAMWEGGHSVFAWWYIDLQAPLLRTPFGFDTTDYFLDIVVKPDLAEWIWEDEDEFDQAIKLGIFSSEKAIEIRKEGERIINQVETKQSPFCDGWENWRPPKDWVVPEFPKVWDVICK